MKNLKTEFNFNFTELDEIDEYLKKDNLNDDFVSEISDFKEHLDSLKREIPVFIPLYKYDEHICTGVNRIIKESKVHELNREYFIFTNTSKLDSLKQLFGIKHINVVEVPDSVDSIQKKRVFMFNYAKDKFKNIFQMDADIFLFCLPVLAKHNRRKDDSEYIKNDAFPISCNLVFDIWEYFIQKYDIKHSSLMNNLAFTFSTRKPFVGEHKYFGMIVHNNIEDAVNRNIEYDIHSGWEDIDYVLQYLDKGIPVHYITMMYKSPQFSCKSAVKKDIKSYYKNNTETLLNKWKENPNYLSIKNTNISGTEIKTCIVNFRYFKKQLLKKI